MEGCVPETSLVCLGGVWRGVGTEWCVCDGQGNVDWCEPVLNPCTRNDTFCSGDNFWVCWSGSEFTNEGDCFDWCTWEWGSCPYHQGCIEESFCGCDIDCDP